MTAFRTFSVVDVWPGLLVAAPSWVNSPDPHTRWRSHRWLGRWFKRAALALGAREVGRNVPTGHPRGAFPMTCSTFQMDNTAWGRLQTASRRLEVTISRCV